MPVQEHGQRSADLTVTSLTPDDKSTPSDVLAFKLDCGSASVTAMCSAVNGGAHCDAVTGQLNIFLAGSCGACHCVNDATCTGRCG
jgi:hypothetical protein